MDLINEDWEREFEKDSLFLLEAKYEIEDKYYNKKLPAKITLIKKNDRQLRENTSISTI